MLVRFQLFPLGLLLTLLPAALSEPPPAPPAARTDAYGDPLPPGALFRFGSVRWRHADGIRSSALSPDGKLLATAAGRSITVWQIATAKPVHKFPCGEGHGFASPGITFSPDGKRLALVHNSNFACVWDLEAGKELRRFVGKTQHAHSLCRFTPDGKQLIFSGRDGTEFRDLATGELGRSSPAAYVCLLSPDAQTYVRVDEKQVTILGDVETGKETLRLDVPAAHDGIRLGVSFAPDGRSLALVHIDKQIEIRELPNGQLRAAFPLPEAAKATPQMRYPDYRVGFTGDGRTLVLATKEGKIHRWDIATEKELPPLAGNLQPVAGMHNLPGSPTLLTTWKDGIVRRWDLQSGKELTTQEGYQGATHAAYSADGRFVAVGDGRGRVDLWEATNGKLLRTLRQHGSAVARLAFAPNGKSLAVGQTPGAVQIYRMPGGNEGLAFHLEDKRAETYINNLVFSHDSRFLCVSQNGCELRWCDLRTAQVQWRRRYCIAASCSPDGQTVLAAFGGPNLTFLEAATGKQLALTRAAVAGDEKFDVVDALSFSPDGRQIAVALHDGQIALFDAKAQTLFHRFEAVDPSPKRLPGFPDETEGHKIRSLGFSPNSKWLVSGSTDGTVRIWETLTGTLALRLAGHEGEVSEVAFGSDGRTVLSSGRDAQAYLWDVRTWSALINDRSPESLWEELLSVDAAKAYGTMWCLVAVGKPAVELIGKSVKPVAPIPGQEVAQLIADLDHADFQRRSQATTKLSKLGSLAEDSLRKALGDLPSLELRRRAQELLDNIKQDVPTGETLRSIRAIEVLEHIATPEAKQVLESLAKGAPGARVTTEAVAALRRMSR